MKHRRNLISMILRDPPGVSNPLSESSPSIVLGLGRAVIKSLILGGSSSATKFLSENLP